MKRENRLLVATLIALGIAAVITIATLVLCLSQVEASTGPPRTDFREGTSDSILFQIETLAYWRLLAKAERAALEARVRRIVEERKALAHITECWRVSREQTRRVNWDNRIWTWYLRMCPRSTR